MKIISNCPLLSTQQEMELSFNVNPGFEDLNPNYDHQKDSQTLLGLYLHELPYQNEPNKVSNRHNSNDILPAQEENLDNIYVQVKGVEGGCEIDFTISQDDIEIEVNPAWLQDQINSIKCNNPCNETSDESHNQLTAITNINQDEMLVTKLQKENRKNLADSTESSDVKMQHEDIQSPRIVEKALSSSFGDCQKEESNEKLKLENSSIKSEKTSSKDRNNQGKIGAIKSQDETKESDNPLPKKKLRSQKKIDNSVRKAIAKRRLVKPIRKRTKLKSSGESSSSEPMDLAKRRDVVNKTILRVVRRYFTSKFKKAVDMKYGNPSEAQNRYFENIKTFSQKYFGEDQKVNLAEISFYLASIIEPKYMREEDISSCGYTKEDFLVYHYCLYRYSHTRLVNLFENQTLRFLYCHFYTQGRDEVLTSEPSLVKNKDLYSKVMLEFKDPQHFLKPLS
ncbi:unnamed protein product [Moneuplotes crassus]|uniref:Uncharacterized protein n=1 Tax=Euplotes crassus TaxID=5936 RepID=A0AAD1X4I3_EUPCR|nr:unnamed protein product [Moneuplotes crassus]